jgi:NAD(P)-dependent dehydrogenase (short-subunit alcohol dehydrogenase family)
MRRIDGPLAGRVAVVTGAVGGIGTAVCQTLAEAGGAVVVGFRSDPNVANRLAASLPGDSHCALCADVTSHDSLKDLAAGVLERYGRLDILVNCAGTTRFVPHANLDALDDNLIDDIFRTNWRGAFAAIRALKPLLERTARETASTSVIVNLSSSAAVIGMGSNVAYCASKAALNSMTVSLGRALAPAIRVVSVSPGVVETEFIKGMDESWQKEQLSRTPLGRFASPADVAGAVLAVVTTLRTATGCVISIDGGRSIS